MNIIIDIGNSFTKVALFQDGALQKVKQIENLDQFVLKDFCSGHPNIEKAILSSVKHVDSDLLPYLTENFSFFIHLTRRTQLPVTNLYATPETLGNDRIAAVVGASNIFPEKNVLVVDAGTALTFDLITHDKQYLGGNISPGLKMRFKSLHHFTGSLPLCSEKDEFGLVSDSTESAIVSGVQLGMILEIDGYIDQLKKRYKELQVVLTGGDSIFFDKKLKSSIFVNQNLVLIGLNNILEFNVV